MTPEERLKLEKDIEQNLESQGDLVRTSLEMIKGLSIVDDIDVLDIRIRMRITKDKVSFRLVDKDGQVLGKSYSTWIPLKQNKERKEKDIYYAIDPKGRILPEEIVKFLRQEVAMQGGTDEHS